MSMFRWMMVAVAVASAVPASARAQVGDTVYVGLEHSPTASALLEFVFPTAGFAYAGDWHRGFLPNAFRIAATIGVAAQESGDECEDECAVWAVALLGTTVWAMVEAVRTAKDYNAVIREPASLLLVEPGPYGGVSMGLRLTR
jgi:hypothetical protein